MRYNPEDVADLIEAGFTEAPVELGSDGPVTVFSPGALRENPVQQYEEATRPMLALGARYLSVNVERFTDLPKIGLNPQNEYDTPTGIYWYDRDAKHADFATTRKYVIRATLAGACIDLGNLDDYAVDNLISAIQQVFAIRITYAKVDEESAFFIGGRVREAEENDLDPDAARAAATWWSVTRLCADRLAKREKRKQVDAWTTVFRRLGIDYVYDPGFGVIHRQEPAQIVSFDPRVIRDAELEERARLKTDKKKQSVLFKFIPSKYRSREDEKAGRPTAQQRIEEEGRRPCDSVQLLVIDRDNRTFTRRAVGVEDIVTFSLLAKGGKEPVPVGLEIDMILHEKVLVSLCRPDGGPLSKAEIQRLNNDEFFGYGGKWTTTFFQCGVFGAATTHFEKLKDEGFILFNKPREACRLVVDAVVTGANFGSAAFANMRFKNCYFDRASFVNAKLLSVTFENCYLREADFSQSLIEDCKFDRCLTQDADFSEARIPYVVASAVTRADIAKTNNARNIEPANRDYEEIAWMDFWPEKRDDDKLDFLRKMLTGQD